MKCDIIIPVWNQLGFTKDCIESIIENTRYPYRLIIIDNASNDETRRYLDSIKYRKNLAVELIRNEENLGFVKAINQGLSISDASYVCVLNNDTIPAPGWLERMIEFAEHHKEAGLINPQCNGHGGTPIEIYAKMLEKNKGKFMEMNQCQGFCMLIKREVIERIGYLDEAFGVGGFDDTDYSMRTHLAGYRCVAIKDAYVYHRLHGSFDSSGDREDWVRRNQKIYYDKWGKHLRIGIPVTLDLLDREALSHIIMLAYGLAREWSWVHIWLNSRGAKNSIKESIEDILDKNELPPHQNIRMDYYSLPKSLFSLVVSGKLLERLRKKMQDKKFDAVVGFDDDIAKFISPLAKLTKDYLIAIPFDEKIPDWQRKGKELALFIKKRGSKS